MRHKIWKKDDDGFLVNGKRLEMDPSVVKLEDDMAVIWQFDFEREPLGQAHDIRLEDGEITCLVDWHDEELSDEAVEKFDFRLTGFYMNVEKNEAGTAVTSAKLMLVSLIIE